MTKIAGPVGQPRSFVDAHAPHGRASAPRRGSDAGAFPCSLASTSTRANVAGAVGPRPSASLEDPYVQVRHCHVREDHPQRERHAAREAGGCRG